MSGGIGHLILSGPLLFAVPVAAAAGAVTFLSPCVLPLVPGSLSYVTGLSGVDAQAAGDSPGGGARGGSPCGGAPGGSPCGGSGGGGSGRPSWIRRSRAEVLTVAILSSTSTRPQ